MSVFSKSTSKNLMSSGLDAFQWVAQKNALIRLNEDAFRQIKEIRDKLKNGDITLEQCLKLLSDEKKAYREKRTKILKAKIQAAKIGGEVGKA